MSCSPYDPASRSCLLETNALTMLEKPITVLVVDDHALVCTIISQILTSQPEIERIITAQNCAEAEKQAAKLSPDIIWLDIHITHRDGIAEIRRLMKLSPDSRILALADEEDEQEAFAAVMVGAQGYRSKQDLDPDDIMPVIRTICCGAFALRPALLTRLLLRLRAAAMPLWGYESMRNSRMLLRNGEYNGLAELTTREREILQLISQGHRDRDIAEGLHISEKTVQKHVQSILSKLDVQNRTEAAYLIHHHAAS